MPEQSRTQQPGPLASTAANDLAVLLANLSLNPNGINDTILAAFMVVVKPLMEAFYDALCRDAALQDCIDAFFLGSNIDDETKEKIKQNGVVFFAQTWTMLCTGTSDTAEACRDMTFAVCATGAFSPPLVPFYVKALVNTYELQDLLEGEGGSDTDMLSVSFADSTVPHIQAAHLSTYVQALRHYFTESLRVLAEEFPDEMRALAEQRRAEADQLDNNNN